MLCSFSKFHKQFKVLFVELASLATLVVDWMIPLKQFQFSLRTHVVWSKKLKKMADSNKKITLVVTLLYLTLLPVTVPSEVEGDIEPTIYDYHFQDLDVGNFELIGGLSDFPAIERVNT